MKILVACEESQAVTIELRKLGHEAYSCDILPCSGEHPGWHIQEDVLPLLNGFCEFKTVDNAVHKINSRWDMIIAFPPCTYLSNCGATWLYPQKGVLNQERYQKGLKAKEFFMMFYNADCERIAIENPISSKIYELPQRSQIIQPYEYGHPYSKKTCLWLKGLPKLASTNILSEYVQFVSSGSATRKGLSSKDGMKTTAKDRAKTFSGIAKAMAEQWG
jgi:hypothetical protein